MDDLIHSANCVDCGSGNDEGRCEEVEHDHSPIYCMWHGQTYNEHEVGGMCHDCHRQWFFEPDWSTATCRAAREFEASSRLRLFFARLDRMVMGWGWKNAWTYNPKHG